MNDLAYKALYTNVGFYFKYKGWNGHFVHVVIVIVWEIMYDIEGKYVWLSVDHISSSILRTFLWWLSKTTILSS